MVREVFAQAKLLSGVQETGQAQLLQFFCQAAVTALTARLRDGLSPKDCTADFVAAASLYALAAYSETDPMTNLEQLQLGDMTFRPGSGNAAAVCLRKQADMMMLPYCVDGFSCWGV
jgi:hypothetical protein